MVRGKSCWLYNHGALVTAPFKSNATLVLFMADGGVVVGQAHGLEVLMASDLGAGLIFKSLGDLFRS